MTLVHSDPGQLVSPVELFSDRVRFQRPRSKAQNADGRAGARGILTQISALGRQGSISVISDVKQLTAIGMYGTSGASRRMRTILAESIAAPAACTRLHPGGHERIRAAGVAVCGRDDGRAGEMLLKGNDFH